MVPEGYCAEMVAISSWGAHLLTHRAGFFDPGFADKAVLELLNLTNQPTSLSSGQKICTMLLQRLAAKPTNQYGKTTAAEPSNYTNNQLLAKFFKPWKNFTLSELQQMKATASSRSTAQAACLKLGDEETKLVKMFLTGNTRGLKDSLPVMLESILEIANEYNLDLETLLQEKIL